MHCLGDSSVNWPDVVKHATSLLLACYGLPKLDNMTQRSERKNTKAGRRSNNMPKLCFLFRTEPISIENTKRAYFQICIWRHVLDVDDFDLDPVHIW